MKGKTPRCGSKRVQPTRGWTVAAQRTTNCRPSGPAGWMVLLLLKAGDVETNPGPKRTRTQVWICDI